MSYAKHRTASVDKSGNLNIIWWKLLSIVTRGNAFSSYCAFSSRRNRPLWYPMRSCTRIMSCGSFVQVPKVFPLSFSIFDRLRPPRFHRIRVFEVTMVFCFVFCFFVLSKNPQNSFGTLERFAKVCNRSFLLTQRVFLHTGRQKMTR